MTATAFNDNLKIVLTGHYATRIHGHVASGHAGHAMEAIDGVHRETLEQTIVYHSLGASAVFFIWLEYKIDGTVKLTVFS